MTFDIDAVRSGFPALSRSQDGQTVAHLDGPGGTQVHASVIAAMGAMLERGGSNLGGPFSASQDSVEVVAEARSAVADLLGSDPGEIVFGQNMTSLTYAMSRAITRGLSSTDNVVVTRLDHDANVAPWIQAAETVGAQVRFIDFLPDAGCRLDPESIEASIDANTAVVAVTAASNATGTVTDLSPVITRAHGNGALVYVDAVHFTPHRLVDVRALDADFLACSSYKWFGPHTGIVYGKTELLDRLHPFKLRPSPDTSPDRWETGTQSFESLAGVRAAVDYLASLGSGEDRRSRIVDAMHRTSAYEEQLSRAFLDGVEAIDGITLVGPDRPTDRTPTFAVDVRNHPPAEVAAKLAAAGIFVWSGDYYAWEVMRRLERPDGLVRIGFVHYNTVEEVDQVVNALQHVAAGA